MQIFFEGIFKNGTNK